MPVQPLQKLPMQKAPRADALAFTGRQIAQPFHQSSAPAFENKKRIQPGQQAAFIQAFFEHMKKALIQQIVRAKDHHAVHILIAQQRQRRVPLCPQRQVFHLCIAETVPFRHSPAFFPLRPRDHGQQLHKRGESRLHIGDVRKNEVCEFKPLPHGGDYANPIKTFTAIPLLFHKDARHIRFLVFTAGCSYRHVL